MFFIPKIKQNYPAVTEAQTFASISLLDVHHVSSQHFKDTMQRLNQNSGSGPAASELEVVHASQIFLNEKKSDTNHHVSRSADDNENEENSNENKALLNQDKKRW